MALDRENVFVRMPGGLKKAIKVHADSNLRSFNSELLARLAASLNGNGKADPRQLSLFGSERTKHAPRPRPRKANRTKRKGVDAGGRPGRTKHAARAPSRSGRTTRKGAKHA